MSFAKSTSQRRALSVQQLLVVPRHSLHANAVSAVWSVQRFLQEHGQVQLSAIGLGEFSCGDLFVHISQVKHVLHAYFSIQQLSCNHMPVQLPETNLLERPILHYISGQTFLPPRLSAGHLSF